MINFFNTYIDKSALKKISSIFRTTFISEGKMVKEFEFQLIKKLGLKNPIAVNSGTSALHLALDLAEVRDGDEVITTPQTFVATALAILYQKAKPVFVDIQYETGNIDPKKIEEKITKKTKVIMIVHWGGYPCDMDEINNIAKKYKLIVIEDAAHALGAMYKNKPIGTISPLTCLSFQAIKHVTTGDGGAVCCLDPKLARKGYSKRWFGIDRLNTKASILGERQYDISEIGYKYHLNDYGAVLGLANLSGFKERLSKRRKVAQYYNQCLTDIPGITRFQYKSDRQSSYWLYGLHVEKRNDFIKALSKRGVPTTVVHQRIDRNSIFGGITKKLFNQEKFDKTQINIPLHDGIDMKTAHYIVNSIKKGW